MVNPVKDSIRVLHVDDDPDFIDLTRRVLENENDRFVVDSVTDPDNALDYLTRTDVDCVVSDFEISGQSGIEFLEAVRDRNPDFPFILFTSKRPEEVAHEAISAGVTDYLYKQGSTDKFTVLSNRIENAVEQARADRERRLRLEAIETAQEGISILDADGHYRYVNETYAGIYGYDPDEMVGKHKDIVYPEDVSFTEDILPTVREKGRIQREGTGHGADGKTVPIRYIIATTETDVLICTAKDVSERRDRERKLAALNSIAADIAASRSVTEICERTVEASEKILEFDLSVVDIEEDGYLRKRAISHQTSPEDTTMMPVDEGIAGKTYRTGESLLIDDIEDHDEAKPQGPYQSAISIPIGEYGVFQAVAEERENFDDSDLELAELLIAHTEQGLDRLESERERKRGRERLSAAFEAIPEPVVHVRFEEGRPIVQTVNSAFEDVFGYAGDEINKQSLNDLIVPDDRRPEAKGIDKETLDSTIVERQVERLAADGRREFLFRAGTLDSDGNRHEGIGIYIDITERLERERAIEQQNERLEEFANVVSHDLRNPLHVATARLELVREQCESEHLDAVADAHDRMESLIDTLLTLARDGREVEEKEPIDLATITENCWQNVDTANATLSVETDRSIHADRSRFKQSLENLMRNAIEHAGPEVTVRVGDTADGFYVEDDGPGIPEDEREQVFERGYSTSSGGAGFGLPIVKQVIEAHGWNVEVTESDSNGVRFDISGLE